MTKQIWKFPIYPYKTDIEIPIDAEILTVQTQNGIACIWALVNPNNNKELRHFELYGTGHDISYETGIEIKYINTFQIHGGDLVFHLFERLN